MATKVNLSVDQGTNFEVTIQLFYANDAPLDVGDYTASAQFRKHYSSIAATDFNILLANGNLILSLTPDQTANVSSGGYVYDVFLRNGTDGVTKIVEGTLQIIPSVTR